MGPCFECGNPADHDHHVVPRSKGGTKTVPLCHACHGLVHGRSFLDHGVLTKAALAAAKARGVKLGNPENLTAEARKKGAASTGAKAAAAYKNLAPMVLDLHGKGMSYRAIADHLNDLGEVTSAGKPFNHMAVKRMLERVALV